MQRRPSSGARRLPACAWGLLVAWAAEAEATHVATALVSRHGQRPNFALPDCESASGPCMWSDEPFPPAAAWNMTQADAPRPGVTAPKNPRVDHPPARAGSV